jgi:hypothetical protein
MDAVCSATTLLVCCGALHTLARNRTAIHHKEFQGFSANYTVPKMCQIWPTCKNDSRATGSRENVKLAFAKHNLKIINAQPNHKI